MITSKSKYMVIYSNLASDMRTVPLSEGMPVPKPSNNVTTDKDNSDFDEVIQTRWENELIVIRNLNKAFHSQKLVS